MDDFKTQSCTSSDLLMFTHMTNRGWIQIAWELNHWGRMEMEPSTGTSMALVCTKRSRSRGTQTRTGKCASLLFCPPYTLAVFVVMWLANAHGVQFQNSAFMFAWALGCNYSWHCQLLVAEGYHLEFSIVLFFQQWSKWINITRQKEKGKTTKEEKTRRPSAEVR